MTPSPEDAPLIDAHFHVWRRGQPIVDDARYIPTSDATVEELVATHDAHGVLFGVIAATSFHGAYNDYVRGALAAHRRLRATAILPPTTDIHTMERMRAEGFVGVRLMWAIHDEVPDIMGGAYQLFLRRVADLGWHVHLVERPERLARAIAGVEASGARLVIDHMGQMQTPEGTGHESFRAILAAIERGNTWAKISARFRFDPVETADRRAEELLRVGADERILWGSDWPFPDFEGRVSYASVLADLRHLVPDPAMRRAIDRTGLRFYFG